MNVCGKTGTGAFCVGAAGVFVTIGVSIACGATVGTGTASETIGAGG